MAKVQHGWEHRSIAEVEQLAAKLSPRTTLSSPPRNYSTLDSPRAAQLNATPGLSSTTSRLSVHDAYGQISPSHSARSYAAASDITLSPPSKRHSGSYRPAPSSSQGSHPAMHPPGLAPPAEIRASGPARRTSLTHPPPSLSAKRGHSPSRSPPNHVQYHPSTPKSARGRPATIRTQTQTQQAEQDAMDALMLMGSPNNSGHFPRNSQQSSSQPSPFGVEEINGTTTRPGPQCRSDSNQSHVSSSSVGHVSSGVAPALGEIEAAS